MCNIYSTLLSIYELFVGEATNGILHCQNYKPCFTTLNWKSILPNTVLTFSIFQTLANKTNLVAKEETWKESDLEDTGDSHQILGKAGIANTVRVVANKIISSSGRNK